MAEALEGDGRDSAEELRVSEMELVEDPIRLTTGTANRADARDAPSMLLGPGASTRNEPTERFALMPSTHPFANSISPVSRRVPIAATHTRPPTWLMLVGAILLLGIGAAAGHLQPAGGEQTSHTVLALAQAPAAVTVGPTSPNPATKADKFAAAEAPPGLDAKVAAAKKSRVPVSARPNTSAAAPGTHPALPQPAQPRVVVPAGPKRRGSTAQLPAQPSREQVEQALERVATTIGECVGENSGIATVSMTVLSSGTVSYALVSGTFAGTPEGSCIARMAKRARFPAFTDPTIRITYPFQF